MEIKNHSFFDDINWEKMEWKEIPAPIKPVINHSLDTSNFSREFTELPLFEMDQDNKIPSEMDYYTGNLIGNFS